MTNNSSARRRKKAADAAADADGDPESIAQHGRIDAAATASNGAGRGGDTSKTGPGPNGHASTLAPTPGPAPGLAPSGEAASAPATTRSRKRKTAKTPAGGSGKPDGSHGGGDGSSRRWVWWLAAAALVLLPLALLPPALLVEEGPVSDLLHDSLGLPRFNVNLALPSFDTLIAAATAAATGGGAANGTAGGGSFSLLTMLFGVGGDALAAEGPGGGGAAATGRTAAGAGAGPAAGAAAGAAAQIRYLLSQLPALSLPALPPQLGGGSGNGSAAAGDDGESGLRPGLAMARRGYRAKHPVVIIPGFVTSGLELWQGLPCGQKYFRQRMWGTLAMVQAFLTDAACWFRHMELDPATGLDPEGVKIRAATGLEAVDYFIQGYWVWGKMVEALADIGYDSNNLVSMSYDWRLAMPLLEERDGYFTRLRGTIESLVELSGERVVVTAHSYGENVFRAFMTWVEAADAAEGEEAAEDGPTSPGWVERHVAAVVNMAGTALGVPKSVTALLSGETRDTAQLGALAGFLTSNMVPRATRTRVWRTWGASYAMLPVGGRAVWGNATWAPDDTPEMRAGRRTFGAMVSLWPHNWQSVLAAAAAAAATALPPQREELQQLVADVAATAAEPEPAAAAATAAAADGICSSGNGSSGNVSSGNVSGNSSSGSSSGGSGGSSSNPMSVIADTLKKLVGSGSSVDAAEHLNSEHVARLDVSGFLTLLREVGGPMIAANVEQWGAVDWPAEETAEASRRRAAAAGEHRTAQAEQSVGGAERLLRTTSGDPAAAAAPGSASHSATPNSSAPHPSTPHSTTPNTSASHSTTPHPSTPNSSTPHSSSTPHPSAHPTARRRSRGRMALFPDATRTPLPRAPTTILVCLYGVGVPTERGYHYLRPPPPASPAAAAAAAAAAASAGGAATAAGGPAGGGDGSAGSGSGAGAGAGASALPGEGPGATGGAAVEVAASEETSGGGEGSGGGDAERSVPSHASATSGEEARAEAPGEATAGWMIMKEVTHTASSLDVGVQLADGDGTVPLISLGLMCRGGWKSKGRLNPGGMRVVTREYKHRSVSLLQDSRGGPSASSHIEILGNEGVVRDVLAVAAGRAEELDDVVVTEIDRIAAAVDWT